MRIPLAVSLESRDGTTTRDAKVLNGVVEVMGEQRFVRTRPGNADLGLVKAGTAQLLYNWNGINAILADHFMRGTIGTIVSAPTDTALSPTNASLLWSAAATNNNAATPRLMFKNRSQAKYMNRAGTISSITFASNMGAGTYSILTLTRSGATATATTAEDIFNVGDTVTVAGATDAAYNGAKTVTAITSASVIPAVDIPIDITRSGTTASAATVSGDPHGLTNGASYAISGANQSAYNGTFTITTTSTRAFTYTVTVTPGTTTTWNSADKNANVTLSGGDLVASYINGGSLAFAAARANSSHATGKWFFEITVNAAGTSHYVGLAAAAESLSLPIGSGAAAWGYAWTGSKQHSASITAYAATWGAGDVIGVAADLDSQTITFYKNGVSQGQAFSGVTGTLFPAWSGGDLITAGTATVTANFGATAFTYAAPSGFSAWQADSPITPATGTIVVTKPAVTVNPTFSYTVAGTPATPDNGANKTATADGGTVPGIPYINGYFFVMDVNGVIWNSDIDDPSTWGALAFVTAQFENGAGKALGKSQNYLIAFKEWSTEFFYDASLTPGSPLAPVDNGFTRVGCANGFSLADVDGGLLWIAQTKQEGRSVYMMKGLDQAKVSTPDIDRILNADSLATVYAYGLELDGHPLYLLTLVGSDITLVYDVKTQIWSQWSSYTLGSSKSISGITRSDDIATVEFSAAHTLSDGDPVLIAGATQTEYNGIFQASVVDSDTITISVSGSPTTPATGTITGKPYTESYFKFTQATNYMGGHLLLHESDGHLYQISSSLYRDAGLPINVFTRSVKLDGGTSDLKKMGALTVVADKVASQMMVRYSDDDSETQSAYRRVDLDLELPRVRRLGVFRRRVMETRHVGNYPLRAEAIELEIGQ